MRYVYCCNENSWLRTMSSKECSRYEYCIGETYFVKNDDS